uniref:Uncharacterized protein n=1 Tax=Rangifer tarandus platyrhynchus TaxID=3082113 RepID=A0ACB0FMW7_RANTA|nr:unnamed protein product [Rangifer tarandus platyrhynchus]
MVSISLPLCILMVYIWTLWMLPFPLVVSEVSGAPRLWLGPPTRGPEANSPQRSGGEWISGEDVWQLPRSAVDSQRYKWILCQTWGPPFSRARSLAIRVRGGSCPSCTKTPGWEGAAPRRAPLSQTAAWTPQGGEGCPMPPSLCKTSPPPSLTPASCFEAAT